ncbi:hypothetical protein FG458_000085 [Yersinia enterocolitica]|nr:hypothetical protein [Yersinia enterocolitica]EKN5117642.1 hypothetical protein [Yersinia enterocolitica]
MVFLGLIVAKLYPDWWKGALATVGIYLFFFVIRLTIANTVNRAKNFSIVMFVNYIIGLIFCLSILISSVFVPVSIARFSGAPYEVGYLSSVACLALSLLYLWQRTKNKI